MHCRASWSLQTVPGNHTLPFASPFGWLEFFILLVKPAFYCHCFNGLGVTHWPFPYEPRQRKRVFNQEDKPLAVWTSFQLQCCIFLFWMLTLKSDSVTRSLTQNLYRYISCEILLSDSRLQFCSLNECNNYSEKIYYSVLKLLFSRFCSPNV